MGTGRTLSILSVASEWHSGHGGISTLNRELCCALARLGHRVLCGVPTASDAERSAAAARNVLLVTPEPVPGIDGIEALSRPFQGVGGNIDVVIGHGRITGGGAVAQVVDHFSRARYVHFVHTDPKAIEWTKHGGEVVDATTKADQRCELEVALGRRADLVAAVGPELHGWYAMYFHPYSKPVHLFLPGLLESTWSGSPPPGIACLVFGRAEDAELKGLFLAAEAMGSVCAERGALALARLVVRGAPPGHGDHLQAKLVEAAGKMAHVVVEPYTSDAEKVRNTIRSASLVLMPSSQEGFGLSGLEAISEGVPVLLSHASGLAQAIEHHLPDLAPLHIVDVRDGAEELATRIRERLNDRESAFAQARALRQAMRVHFDWDGAASKLIHALESSVVRPHDGERPPSISPTAPSATAALSATLASASSALLSWQQTLRTTDQWIERPEFEKVLTYARGDAARPLMLLGAPGSGKSAILARAAKHLLVNGVSVLGVKADTIPNTVNTLAALADELNLPSDITSAIAAVAAVQPTVLFIDQLDALADLVDLHTGRLSVLLELASRLSEAGVRVVMSCRAFDFAHDVRFKQLKANELQLEPPTSDAMNAILAANNVDATQLPPRVQEIVKTPQLLDALLELRARGEGIQLADSQQKILAQLWRARLGSDGTALQLSQAAERIAILMAEREELWVSRAVVEAKQLSQFVGPLVRAGLLIQKDDRLSFVHQTMFEHGRARAFASTGEALSAYVFDRQDALFVRPTMWTSLEYLRATDRTAYFREFDALWIASNLRRHVRRLLWEFLGQRADPAEREIALVSDGIADEATRRTVLSVIAGKPAWFQALRAATLPAVMRGSDAEWVVGIIVSAFRFAPHEATELVEDCWRDDPSKAGLIATALILTERWSEQMASLATRVVADGALQTDTVDSLVHRATTARPDEAARLIAVHLKHERDALGPIPAVDDGEDTVERAFAERRRLEPFRDLVDRSGGLHWAIEAAKAAPKSFLGTVWPWFVGLVRELSRREPVWTGYRDDNTVGTSLRGIGGVHELSAAIDTAIRTVAETDPSAIVAFVSEWQGEETVAVHRFLMAGLRASLPASVSAAIAYLHGDPRRLVVGNWGSEDRESTALIEALAPHVPVDDLPAIEDLLARSRSLREDNRDDVGWRREAHNVNRQHRLRLLLALGTDRLSSPRRTFVEQERRRFPDVDEAEVDVTIRTRRSPVTSEQMLRAKDEHILNLFSELPDSTEWSHPSRPHEGGSIEAARELAEAAKKAPERFASLIHRFRPGVTERPVANVFGALAEVVPFSRLEDKLYALVASGFFEGEYREEAAWALHRALRNGAVMRPETCALLESWLTDGTPSEPAERAETRTDDPLLFGMRGGGSLPGGNFPILLALTVGYLAREEPAIDSWLTVLERHLQRAESSAVWEALASRLDYVLWADPQRADSFLTRLFSRFPRVRDSRDGLTIVARAIHHLPQETIARWITDIESGVWSRRLQAIGELLGLLVTRGVVADWAQVRVEEELSALGAGQQRSPSLVLGLAYTAAQLWGVPERRARANDILVRIVPHATGALASAVAGAFRSVKRLVWDDASRSLLSALRDNPRVLAADRGPWLLDHLREALPTGADLIADVTLAMVSAIAKADQRGQLFSRGPDLVDVSLTLQRLGGTSRQKGMDLFELLLELNAYGIDDALAELDGTRAASRSRGATT